jgi:hypothetical protein
VIISNLLGQILHEEQVTNSDILIDCSDYQTGAYFVIIEQGNQIFSKKFIID